MQFLSSIAMATALIAAPAAFAQDVPAAAPAAPAAPAQAAAPVTDTEVSQFATAAVAGGKIQNDTTIPAADKTAKLVEAITATGLTADRFNEIAQKMQSDPALAKRITDAAATQAKPAA